MKKKRKILLYVLSVFILMTASFITVEAASKPAKTSISSVKSTEEGKLTVKWKKKKYKGYQIQIATNSKFTKNKKSYTVNGSSKTSKTISSLKKGKKYYVRVRTFKKSGKKKIYSGWSKAKSVTIHKHSYKGKETKASTCITPGIKTFTCSCGKKYTNNIPEVTHSLDSNKICKSCKELCVIHTYGKTKFIAPANTNKDYVVVNMINSSGKTSVYKVHNQKKGTFKKYSDYLREHGCAVSSLTCLLNTRVSSLQFYTPDQTIPSVEKSVLGSKLFEKNYSRTLAKQMPITLYGMTKVFTNMILVISTYTTILKLLQRKKLWKT